MPLELIFYLPVAIRSLYGGNLRERSRIQKRTQNTGTAKNEEKNNLAHLVIAFTVAEIYR
jgi:hypothetical protein